MALWQGIPGETPIDPTGLRRPGSIRNRKELNVAEANNILPVVTKYLGRKPTRRMAPFDYSWTRRLHKAMFGDVWKWAGEIRTRKLTLHGSPVVEWPEATIGDASRIRNEYLAAVQAADGGGYDELLELQMRFMGRE